MFQRECVARVLDSAFQSDFNAMSHVSVQTSTELTCGMLYYFTFLGHWKCTTSRQSRKALQLDQRKGKEMKKRHIAAMLFVVVGCGSSVNGTESFSAARNVDIKDN
jgi:hypothetical protein